MLFTLNQLCPSTKIIHGKPRYPQSQGSVESANKRIENILSSLLDKSQQSNWVSELERGAYMKNTTIHSGCKKSPYKILYNRDPPKGLRDLNIPEELHHTINRTEDLKAFNPDFDIECDDQFEFNLKTDTIIKNQESIETELNFTSTSDEYDIEMKFDADSLGAWFIHFPRLHFVKYVTFQLGKKDWFVMDASQLDTSIALINYRP